MNVNLEEIKKEIENGSLSRLSRETGIPLRTLQDWKARKNDWLENSITRLTAIDKYLKGKNNHDNKKIN